MTRPGTLRVLKSREVTPEEIRQYLLATLRHPALHILAILRKRMLDLAWTNARKTLRDSLEHVAKRYQINLAVNDLMSVIAPFIERIVRIGGARLLLAGNVDPLLSDLKDGAAASIRDYDEAYRKRMGLPLDRRRNRRAYALAKFALGDRRSISGEEPTVRLAAVQLGMLAIMHATGAPFRMSRNEWQRARRRGKLGGPMVDLLQAVLLGKV